MNSYDFESKDGKWSLDFPNDGMAIAHGKQNGAFKVSLFGNKIAGLEDIGNGFKAWKFIKYEGEQHAN